MRTTTHLTIRGMLSVHAVRAVSTALTAVDGIERADVALGRAAITHDGRATPERLASAISAAGCEVTAWREERAELPVV